MKCWYCDEELIWQSDYTFEDFGLEGEGIVTVFMCSNDECRAIVEMYKEDNEEGEE